jgi:enamine deaminase RidA (YjgF/YER057c/UK114 family)
VGRIFETDLARHCLLGNICPTDPTADKSIQARQVYEEMEIALVEHGMTLSNIVRSWMYLDDIQRWYGAFNQVRTEIFTQRNMFPAGLPATTDIGTKNPCCAGLVAAVWAVEPRSARFRMAEVKSPLQCAASGYGSCFSRAMELATPTLRHLLVSGTASLGPNGRLMRPRDLPGQIHLTMEVVKALLNSRNMGFENVTRATAYFHNVSDAPAFTSWCCEKRVTLPIIVTQADMCREELLFEIELDAMTETERRQPLLARRRMAQVGLMPFGGSIE